MLVDRLCIVGPGLIGGAIGIAARRKRLTGEVVGVFRRKESLRDALEVGAVDRGVRDVSEGVAGAGLVVLATGSGAYGDILSSALKSLAPHSVVTDVASTKRGVVSDCSKALASRPDVSFVGSHPLAGSERRGPRSAPLVELAGAVCVVTGGRPEAVELVSAFWRSLGMLVKTLTPEEHDELLAAASHLPHLAAAALVLSVGDEACGLAGGGFRDATRIAAGDADMWTEILEANADEIAPALERFSERVDELVKLVRSGDFKRLRALLARASAKRRALDKGSPGEGGSERRPG